DDITACNEDPAVGQKRRRMSASCRIEAAFASPLADVRIVQLRAAECFDLKTRVLSMPGFAADNENFTIRQQRCCVTITASTYVAGFAPRAGGWIVELGAVERNGCSVPLRETWQVSPNDQDV